MLMVEISKGHISPNFSGRKGKEGRWSIQKEFLPQMTRDHRVKTTYWPWRKKYQEDQLFKGMRVLKLE
jgi:hypothetical protein